MGADGLLGAAMTPRSNTSHHDRPDGQGSHGAQSSGSNRAGALLCEHAVIHDRLTGAYLFGLPVDQRAFDGRRDGAEPRPIAGVLGDLLGRGTWAAATEHGGPQLDQPRHGRALM